MSTIAAPQARRLSREDIVRLGQAGRPWDFVPVGLRALQIAPGDAGVRVLVAANLARLGLRTAALEHLAGLGAAAADPSIAELRRALEALPSDRIPDAEAVETCRRNVERLAGRGVDLRAEFEAWREGVRGVSWFRAAGGNIARRGGDGAWTLWGDHRSAVDRFAAEHLAGPRKDICQYTIEGVDPPWMLMAVAAASPRQPDGFWPRLLAVQADAREFLDGLALADLPELAEPRVSVYVGPDASQRLEADLRSRLHTKLAGPYIAPHSLRRRAEPAVAEVLERVDAEQAEEAAALVRETAALYAGRDRALWARRYAEAERARAGGAGEPLRVLVPTSRFSTYIQHASRDLVEALCAAGHRAELLIEPDDSSKLAAVAYLRRIRDFAPDLVILINFHRVNLGEWVPRELPFVCWVQDAMPHLFDEKVGRSLTEMDFVAGHLLSDLFHRYGYPRRRTCASPVVASDRKFHPGPVAPAMAKRFECEVAMVSHHSETPEAMRDRLMADAGPAMRAPLSAVYDGLIELARDPLTTPLTLEIERLVARHVPGPAAMQVAKVFAGPLVDRIVRHEALAWAAEMCRRRGWRLHLYGRGWASHPTLGEFARGELTHGEELRAAYQCAAAHLHVSSNTMTHQRVMECALSAGLPICRVIYEAVAAYKYRAQQAASRREEPTVYRLEDRACGHIAADHPEGLAYLALLGRLGLDADGGLLWVAHRRQTYLERDAAGEWENQAGWILLDLAELGFTCPASLEARLARAIEDPHWRRTWSDAVAARVRSRHTHSALAARIIAMVASSMVEGSA